MVQLQRCIRTNIGIHFLIRFSIVLAFCARPLLIGQGANDPRVKQNESDQIVKAMQAKKLLVTYVLYADEGHGFARPENRLSFYAIAEAFLAEHMGGRYEPIGKDFEGANFTVPVGADDVPGLDDALKERS
ncbi:MAG: prolyl oligopeptidase family serine peptidase [Methanotrichaceae archaeon]|nr:prolyl oligopeptidase family serine peptidase [Methanotrichaceae archaeon]